MSRPQHPLDPAPDGRGRSVVWSAGPPTTGSGPRVRLGWRRFGLVLATMVAVFTLAYAVHVWVVFSRPPVGSPVPRWLPDELPADGPGGTGEPTPSSGS